MSLPAHPESQAQVGGLAHPPPLFTTPSAAQARARQIFSVSPSSSPPFALNTELRDPTLLHASHSAAGTVSFSDIRGTTPNVCCSFMLTRRRGDVVNTLFTRLCS